MSPLNPDFWRDEISSLSEKIRVDFGLCVQICAEIECVVDGLELLPDVDDFWRPLTLACESGSLKLDSIATEEGAGQYEFRLKPNMPLAAADDVSRLTEIVLQEALLHGLHVSFAAKPSVIQPGNGLHWHLHLENEAGLRVFLKQEEQLSPPLRYALGGLLHSMAALMPCFVPTPQSYERFLGAPDHVPQTASWGGNNRTVSLRLPESVIPLRHIEHRVAGADANPYHCVWALLVGVYDGLKHERDCGEQCFGDANQSMHLPRLPLQMQEAVAQMQQAEWLEAYASPEVIAALCATR